MLNTHKLFYLLPDLAYLVELLPGKKPSTFSIASFRQINGDYMSEDELKPESILKLFNKLKAEDEYQLILPDFLFTNTIVSVKEKSDAKIKQHLTEKLLPSLDLKPESHQIDTTILTEHGDTTKVQLSAIEKSVLEPVQISAQQTKAQIKSISPLSWTIKSLISLEPSISVVQIGSKLYIALHYIGVDQTSQASVEEVDNIYETIKTFKGAEPSIQTVYLLSNELVEEQLKEHLSETLPIQQLASKQDDESKMPSYVQKVIEAGMRTLSISDYPVPQFELGSAPKGASIAISSDDDEDSDDEDGMSVEEKEDVGAKKEELPDLPKPDKDKAMEAEKKKQDNEDKEAEKEEQLAEDKTVEAEVIPPVKTRPPAPPVKDEQAEDDEIEALLTSLKTDEDGEIEKAVDKITGEEKKKSKETTQKGHRQKTKLEEPPTQIIKNRDRTKNMLKMIFVTLAVFFATVGVGIGIGLGVLQLTQPTIQEEPMGQVTEVTPTPDASTPPPPTPTPEPEFNKAELSVLVVNATTQAGYAGENADELEASGFGTVEAGNAKGNYETGRYVLMSRKNQALISALEETLGFSLTYQEDKDSEDPKDEYSAVIVLAE